jgi:transcription antitermination factor NusG
MPSWNVLQCFLGSEMRIASKLGDLGFRSLCPTYLATATVFGRKVTIEMPVISSYVFFAGDVTARDWHLICEVKGVTRILGGLVPDEEVRSFCDWVGEDGGYWETRHVPGSHQLTADSMVVITEGIYSGHEGRVVGVGERFCSIKLNNALLGRVVVVKQPILWCSSLDDDSCGSLTHLSSELKRRRGGAREKRRRHASRQWDSSSAAVLAVS